MARDCFDIKDKIVIVTGGLGRLGRGYVLALIARGANVAVFDICCNPEVVQARFGDQAHQSNVCFLEVDITDKAAILDALSLVEARWGTPDALVNNAGLDAPPDASTAENGAFENYPEMAWDAVFDVNIKGPFLCCQVVGASMARAGRGSIINISSIYGIVSPDQRIYDYRRESGPPFYKPVAYSASKSAILNLTRYVATYWGHQNVRANTITFGGVFDNQDNAFLEAYCSRTPLSRMARVGEYDGVIVFLISDASSYMTGANLVVDGGWTAW